jgi:hypothetical protein
MSFSECNPTPIAVVKTYDLVLWLLPEAEKFARSYRFTVGDRTVKLSGPTAHPLRP